MTPSEAAIVLMQEVKSKNEEIIQKRNSRLFRAANALRNAELEVLNGNQSPSPPGSPPGRRSGHLRTAWTIHCSAGGQIATFGIVSGAHYSGYLEHGTRKMAARPFVDKIQEKALPEIITIFSEIGG